MTKRYTFTTTAELTIEKLIQDDQLVINQLILPPGESVAPHKTANRAYMIVTAGTLSLQTDELPEEHYLEGTIVAIQAGTMLAISNRGDSPMRLFVVKPTEIKQDC